MATPKIGQIWTRPGRADRTITDVSEAWITYTVEDPSSVTGHDSYPAWEFWISLGGRLKPLSEDA